MKDTNNKPRAYDVVLGNQALPPDAAVVLGGIQGVKMRLASNLTEVRIAALKEALNYGKAGLDLVIQALNNDSWQVRKFAYSILQVKNDPEIKKALQESRLKNNRFETFVNLGKIGDISDIDMLMDALENEQNVATAKLVDYALSLVKNSAGKTRIKDYLFNGTTMQRNYAALYFKRIKNKDILAEAVKLGCIDRVQAFSK